ncbi:MAG: hypothetical protein AB7O92_33995 [Acidimicrobiia bacterium]
MAVGGKSPAARVDTWLALLAGPGCWIDGGGARPVAVAAMLTELLLGLSTATAPFIRLGTHGAAAATAPSVVATVAIAALHLPTAAAVTAALGGRRRALGPLGHPVAAGALRSGGLIVAVAASTAALGAWTVALSVPAGFMAGSDAFATSMLTGMELGGRDAWLRFARSPLHLGMVLGTVATAVIGFAPSAALVLITVELTAVAACVALALWRLFAEAEAGAADSTVQRALRDERQRHAARLHDDVVSRLRLLRARMEQPDPDVIDLRHDVVAIEHELRIEQLDAALRAGSASIAELVQTYVRFAVSCGVAITEVPRPDPADAALDPATGWLLKRVLAGTVHNAVAAGASMLAVRVERRADGSLAVEVEDDAGGFELGDEHAGRGLFRLRQELDGRLTVTRTATGSCVSALLRTGASR